MLYVLPFLKPQWSSLILLGYCWLQYVQSIIRKMVYWSSIICFLGEMRGSQIRAITHGKLGIKPHTYFKKKPSVNYELKHSTAQFSSQQSSGNSRTLSIAQRLILCNLQWFCIFIQFRFSSIEYSWLQGEGQYRAEKRPVQRELHTSLNFSKGNDGYRPPQRYYTRHFWGILETLQKFISWRYMCRLLEVTKSTLTQWHKRFCRWLGTWNIMLEGYNSPERYYTHHFWEYEKVYRSLFLGGIGGKWSIPQSMCGYRITAHSWVRIFSTSLSLYTVRCQLRDSVDVLMWRQLQWLHAVLLWPELQYLFMQS